MIFILKFRTVKAECIVNNHEIVINSIPLKMEYIIMTKSIL